MSERGGNGFGATAGAMLTLIGAIAASFDDAQVKARGFLRQVPDHDFGTVPIQDVVPRFHHEPGAVYSTGGDVGEHNDEVFGDWLGLSPQARADLRAAGVI